MLMTLYFIDRMRIQTTTASLSLLTITILFLGVILSLNYNHALAQELDSSNLSKIRIVDPNPTLIDNKTGSLINDISLAANINETRTGTIADGVSKLLLVVNHEDPVKFSILEDESDQSSGTLSSLSSTETGPSSSVIISPLENDTKVPFNVAVYTPPLTYSNSSANETHKTIEIFVQDANNPSINTTFPLSLYRVPVILVHGIWTDSELSWNKTNFTKTLNESNIDVYLADYRDHNATTFDPNDITGIGNHGIDSIRKQVNETLSSYHDKRTAASQVDIIGHSMGGLMARGFVQQPDYESQANYMQGYIHRLITIGTPHFGGHLAEILYDHRNDKYCVVDEKIILHETLCDSHPTMELVKFYASAPLDQGGIEALAPGSIAYQRMCETQVPSYAIVGSWTPNANHSHNFLEQMYRNITGNSSFDLDIDGFNGTTHGNNDLQVTIDSQLGGLSSDVQGSNPSIPYHSKIYNNTVHSKHLIEPEDNYNVIAELYSPDIQSDTVKLLQSSHDKFADAIGMGSPCQPSESDKVPKNL